MKNILLFILFFTGAHFVFAQDSATITKILNDFNHGPFSNSLLSEDLMTHTGKTGKVMNWQTIRAVGLLYPFFGKSVLKQNGTEYMYRDGWHLIGHIDQEVEAGTVIFELDFFEILLIFCLIGALIYSPLVAYENYRRIFRTDFQNINMKRRMSNFEKYKKRLNAKIYQRNDLWEAFLLSCFSFYFLLMTTGTLPDFMFFQIGIFSIFTFSALGIIWGNIWVKKTLEINEEINENVNKIYEG